jgi:flagellar biosynthesis protein FlhF
MKLVSFVAETAGAALMQIHKELGPDAVVVSVRKLPAQGIARLWRQDGKVEVIACVPTDASESESLARPDVERAESFGEPTAGKNYVAPTARRWRSIGWLEAEGLMPQFADELEQKICAIHGEDPPTAPLTEWTIVRDVLTSFWQPARQVMTGTGRPHVFIGPAGSGKTAALCKWMTAAVLFEESSVRAWRLDGETANAAEFLSLHCEMVGVPVERFWRAPATAVDLDFVDLPGVEIHDSQALTALQEQVAVLPQPHVHLVLNAAYENSILFQQFDAFAAFAPEDVLFTHLDEERRRVKLWNFVLGTNCSMSFLGAGQKIPGEFRRAEPAGLFPQKNRR